MSIQQAAKDEFSELPLLDSVAKLFVRVFQSMIQTGSKFSFFLFLFFFLHLLQEFVCKAYAANSAADVIWNFFFSKFAVSIFEWVAAIYNVKGKFLHEMTIQRKNTQSICFHGAIQCKGFPN